MNIYQGYILVCDLGALDRTLATNKGDCWQRATRLLRGRTKQEILRAGFRCVPIGITPRAQRRRLAGNWRERSRQWLRGLEVR